MKLLMITGIGSAKDLASGKKGAFYNTLEEFHKYWERIDIIAPKVQFPISNFQFPNNTKILFGNVFLHISPWPLVFHPIWFLMKGLEIYKEQKFDLITVHEFPPFYNGIGARLLWHKINPHTHFGQFLKSIFLPWQKSKVSVGVKVPYVLEIFHIPGYPKSASIKENIYKFLFKLFIRFDVSKSKAVRVMNEKQVPNFLVRAGVSRDKIVYIPAIYIDLEIFKPTNIPKEYDLIFVGRLMENKGINLFIDAVKKLNTKAIIVGDGPLFKKIKLEIENWKLEIDMHGWAKDSAEIAKLINKSKILVMPSYNEGGPRVVVEAMACGVPVLATLVGVVPDLLKNGTGGEIIAWETDDIVQKVLGLLNDPDKYQRYSHSGLEIAGQFERKAAIRNYADKLKGILG